MHIRIKIERVEEYEDERGYTSEETNTIYEQRRDDVQLENIIRAINDMYPIEDPRAVVEASNEA